MTEHDKNTRAMEAKLVSPEKSRKRSNIMLVTILACWLLLLYFSGGLKGPG
jgi:hypothetical protein